ncbi:MAG: TlpA disulfide reductase family protein [Cellulophaga sp.]
MKISKKQIINSVLVIGVVLILFTPIGFKVKVFASRLLATGVSIMKEGKQLPEEAYAWQLLGQEGKLFVFGEQKGRVVIVNLWATWCPPCVAEMPSFQELYNDYNEEVAFVFVALDEEKRVIKFIHDKQYNLPVYYTKTEVPDLLYSKTIPATFILNKNGEIVVSELGAKDWNSKDIRTLLDKLLLE